MSGKVPCRLWVPFAAIAALGAYLWIHYQYPFWFAWDMDHTTTVDTVLMQSGKWPVHIHHPGFGMYLPLKLSHQLAHWLGFVSVLNLNDLRASLGPLLGVAELEEFLRLHSPLAALGIVLLLWRTITLLFSLGQIAEIGLFFLLALQGALFYQATMIRTELYGVLYWSAALYLFARAAVAREERKEAALAVLGGAFLGLSLLSKIQAVFYVAGALPMLEVFRLQAGKGQGENPWIAGKLRALGWFCLGFSALLLIGAALRRPYGMTFTESYRINYMGVGLAAAALLVFVFSRGYLEDYFRRLGRARLLFCLAVLAGFLGAFLLHFLVYLNPETSYKYMLLDAKMIFYRDSATRDPFSFSAFYSQLRLLVAYNPWLYLSCAILTLMAILRRKRIAGFSAAMVALTLAFLSAFYAARPILRDLLWAETMILLLATWMAIALWNLTGERRVLRFTAVLCLVLAFFGNLKEISRIRKDIDANYNLFLFAPQRLFDGVYMEAHLQFAPSLHLRYGQELSPLRGPAFEQARDYAGVRRAASFSLPNAAIDMKNLGLFAAGQQLMADQPTLRIGRIPESMVGGILVDARQARLDPSVIYQEKYVNDHAEMLDKRVAGPVGENYFLLLRQDLEIFVLSEKMLEGEASQQLRLKPVGAVAITPATKSWPAFLNAYQVYGSGILPRSILGELHFFVIRKRFPG